MKHIIIVVALSCSFAFNWHKFYVSIVKVNANTHSKSFEVSVKIFSDDLELAVEKYFSQKISLSDGDKYLNDSLLNVYCFEKIHIKLDGKKTNPNWVGYEYKPDVTWLFFEFPNSYPLDSISLETNLLMEVFDQESIITHFEQDGGLLKSFLLNRFNTNCTYLYN